MENSLTVAPNISEVILALKREDLFFSKGDLRVADLHWADWLLWLGQWMRAQCNMEGRRVVVVRLPNRRLAAALVALGSAFASARLFDDSLDWERLKDLAPGQKVYWREDVSGKSVRRSGLIKGLRQIEGSDFLEVMVGGPKRAGQGSRLFAKSAALSYGITLSTISAASDSRVDDAEGVFDMAVSNAKKGWPRSPNIECTIFTEKTSFRSDLEGLTVSVAGTAKADCLAIMAATDSSTGTQGKTRLVSPHSKGFLADSEGLVILDGAAASRRINDTSANSIILLLDHSDYDEEVEQLLQTYLDNAEDAGIYPPEQGVMLPPKSIQTFIFGLPLQARPILERAP